jgi:hypothetical protein
MIFILGSDNYELTFHKIACIKQILDEQEKANTPFTWLTNV